MGTYRPPSGRFGLTLPWQVWFARPVPGEPPNLLDETEDAAEDVPQPPAAERPAPPTVAPSPKLAEGGPLDAFLPAPSKSEFRVYASEDGAKILLTLYHQAVHERNIVRAEATDLRVQVNTKAAECQTLQLRLATEIRQAEATSSAKLNALRIVHTRVADRLRHLRSESWIVPTVTALGGILLSTYWKLKDDDPTRPYCLWVGLLLMTSAIVLLFLRGFKKRDDEMESDKASGDSHA